MWHSSRGGGAAGGAGVPYRAEEDEDARPGERSACRDEPVDDKG